MTVTVHTQAELDQALADKADAIYIESDAGVWLTVTDSGSSRVVAWDSSSVEARGSSRVEARDSSRVVARDSSRVEASKYVAVHLHSQRVTLSGDGHVIDITAIDLDDPATWCEFHGVKVIDGIAYLYKAVNQQWTTDRGVDYSPGSTPEAPDWDPSWRDCGKGLHFCDHPMRSLDFLGGRAEDARFLKVGVRLDELIPLGGKAKARRVVVACVEVDRHGDLVEVTA